LADANGGLASLCLPFIVATAIMPQGMESVQVQTRRLKMSESTSAYYCWVRVIPATLEGSAYEIDEKSMHMLNGPKRPKRTGTSGASGFRPAVTVWFDSDDVHYGNPKSDVVFDFGPAYADRCLAVEWLGKHGRQWAKEADNFFLLKVDLEG
jgi:hypothetical protein